MKYEPVYEKYPVIVTHLTNTTLDARYGVLAEIVVSQQTPTTCYLRFRPELSLPLSIDVDEVPMTLDLSQIKSFDRVVGHSFGTRSIPLRKPTPHISKQSRTYFKWGSASLIKNTEPYLLTLKSGEQIIFFTERSIALYLHPLLMTQHTTLTNQTIDLLDKDNNLSPLALKHIIGLNYISERFATFWLSVGLTFFLFTLLLIAQQTIAYLFAAKIIKQPYMFVDTIYTISTISIIFIVIGFIFSSLIVLYHILRNIPYIFSKKSLYSTYHRDLIKRVKHLKIRHKVLRFFLTHEFYDRLFLINKPIFDKLIVEKI